VLIFPANVRCETNENPSDSGGERRLEKHQDSEPEAESYFRH
jgi:hypothetical protein